MNDSIASSTRLHDAQQRLAKLYAGDTFAAAGEAWVSELSEHFRQLQGRDVRVLNWAAPDPNIALASSTLHPSHLEPADTDQWLPEFATLIRRVLTHGQNLHHPRYVGHQVPASIPIAALFDAIGTATNQVMAIYEMGPWATSVERAMISQLGAEIGYAPGTFGGLITNGGSLANLTCLLTARNVALENVWQHGVQAAGRAALVVQEDVHYCITRAAGILGLGTDQIVRIPVDEQRKMKTAALASTLSELKSAGRQVIAVVASACGTPIGAFDPLPKIADICEQQGVWMHVDAAHGGSAVFSEQHRHLVDGIERADSVVWDAHKMLFMPALCAFGFYKNKEHRFAAFEQDAPYLFDPSNPGIAEYDSGIQTLECTKRAAAFGLWGIWSLFGRQIFTDLVESSFAMAQVFHEKLTAASDFVPLHQPECNIQAFRYVPPNAANWSLDKLGDYQLEVRRRVITSGKAYIVPIKLNGIGALRATVINPCTTPDDLDAVLDAIRVCH